MKKRILCITPLFPESPQDDTVVPFIYQFIRHFRRQKNVEIEILTLYYPFKRSCLEFDGLVIHSIGGGFNKGLRNYWTFTVALAMAIQLYRKNRYDGVLSFWYGKTAIIGKVLKSFFKTKHFTWLQGQDVKSKNWYLKVFRPRTSEIFTVGKNHNDLLFKNHKLRSDLIANVAIDITAFPELNKTDRDIDLIGVGNLGPIKNYSFFIDIVFELKQRMGDVRAIICGGGEEMEALTKKIIDLGLTKNLELLGYQKNQKVRQLMNQSKIFLHTSKFEGNSMAIQEALYSGCSVVSTVPLREKVQNFHFIEDMETITKKLINLLQSQTQYSRVKPFEIEATADIIYSSFFEAK